MSRVAWFSLPTVLVAVFVSISDRIANRTANLLDCISGRFGASNGQMLADGEYNQWSDNDRVHATIAFQFSDGRRIEELAKLFVDVPDTQIWLTNPPPAAFLRSEGPVAEPGDPIVRVDVLPGAASTAAEPVAVGSARHTK